MSKHKEKESGLLHGERSYVKPSGLKHYAASIEGKFSIGSNRAVTDSIHGSVSVVSAGSDRKPHSILEKFNYKGEK